MIGADHIGLTLHQSRVLLHLSPEIERILNFIKIALTNQGFLY